MLTSSSPGFAPIEVTRTTDRPADIVIISERRRTFSFLRRSVVEAADAAQGAKVVLDGFDLCDFGTCFFTPSNRVPDALVHSGNLETSTSARIHPGRPGGENFLSDSLGLWVSFYPFAMTTTSSRNTGSPTGRTPREIAATPRKRCIGALAGSRSASRLAVAPTCQTARAAGAPPRNG